MSSFIEQQMKAMRGAVADENARLAGMIRVCSTCRWVLHGEVSVYVGPDIFCKCEAPGEPEWVWQSEIGNQPVKTNKEGG